MSIISEFKKFAMRGSVVDLAVGIIIGSAFGKIVSSLVNDVILPPIGLLIDGVKFTDLKIMLKPSVLDESGKIIKEAVTMNYGNFLQVTVDFLLVAFAVFLLIRVMNQMAKKEEAKPVTPPQPSSEEKLLAEIRDLLKK